MAGVSSASPKNRAKARRTADPEISILSQRGRSGERCAKAASASDPPSPRLCARSTKQMYLPVTTIMSDQKISEMAPHHRHRHGHRAARCQHGLPDRIERARADVSVDDAERAQRQPEISSPPGAEPMADMMLTPLGSGVTRGHLVHRRIITTIAVLKAGVGTEALST